uniref:EB domain-containing protein n=1 Tax=Parastrongyloides trichosuri TaxID=131310 RepID=A0A0N4ZXT2_PARTI
FFVAIVELSILNKYVQGTHETCAENLTKVESSQYTSSNYCEDLNNEEDRSYCLSHINWPNCMCAGEKAINVKCQCVLQSECYRETCGVNFVNTVNGIDSSRVCPGVNSENCLNRANLINCNCKDNHSLNSKCRCVPTSKCNE